MSSPVLRAAEGEIPSAYSPPLGDDAVIAIDMPHPSNLGLPAQKSVGEGLNARKVTVFEFVCEHKEQLSVLSHCEALLVFLGEKSTHFVAFVVNCVHGWVPLKIRLQLECLHRVEVFRVHAKQINGGEAHGQEAQCLPPLAFYPPPNIVTKNTSPECWTAKNSRDSIE